MEGREGGKERGQGGKGRKGKRVRGERERWGEGRREGGRGRERDGAREEKKRERGRKGRRKIRRRGEIMTAYSALEVIDLLNNKVHTDDLRRFPSASVHYH